MDYEPADEELREMAKGLIEKHHEHLVDVQIVYVFALDEIKMRGKLTVGRARKKAGLDAFLCYGGMHPQFFVIEIWKEYWTKMKPKTQLALLDHELAHCKRAMKDGRPHLYIAPHDFEEFNSIIERHGLYHDDAREFWKAYKRNSTGNAYRIVNPEPTVTKPVQPQSKGPEVTAQ